MALERRALVTAGLDVAGLDTAGGLDATGVGAAGLDALRLGGTHGGADDGVTSAAADAAASCGANCEATLSTVTLAEEVEAPAAGTGTAAAAVADAGVGAGGGGMEMEEAAATSAGWGCWGEVPESPPPVPLLAIIKLLTVLRILLKLRRLASSGVLKLLTRTGVESPEAAGASSVGLSTAGSRHTKQHVSVHVACCCSERHNAMESCVYATQRNHTTPYRLATDLASTASRFGVWPFVDSRSTKLRSPFSSVSRSQAAMMCLKPSSYSLTAAVSSPSS